MALLLSGGIALWNISAGLVLFVMLLLTRWSPPMRSPSHTEKQPMASAVSPWLWRISLILLSGNMVVGLPQTSSWPFSAYPSYSFLRSGHIQYLILSPLDAEGQSIDLDALLQSAQISKESLLPLAERGAWLYESQQSGALTQPQPPILAPLPGTPAGTSRFPDLRRGLPDPVHRSRPHQRTLLRRKNR